MAHYLDHHKMYYKTSALLDETKVPVERLEMSWRDMSNKIDCGIFLMRHMETYFGNGLVGWDCGLRKENQQQLDDLRKKYCHEMLITPWNLCRSEVEDHIKNYVIPVPLPSLSPAAAKGKGRRGRGRGRGKK